MAPDSIDPHRCALVLLHLSISPQLPRQSLALIRIEPGWVARLPVFGRAAGRLGRGQHATDARIAGDPLQNSLGHRLHAELRKHALVESPIQAAEARGTGNDNAKATS